MNQDLPQQTHKQTKSTHTSTSAQAPLLDALKNTKRAGFTLLEVMISLSILAMIMAISWGSFFSVAANQSDINHINERLHAIEAVMNRLVRELSMAFVTTHGQESDQLEIVYKTIFKGSNDSLTFTSFANVRMFRNDKMADQTELSYEIRSIRNLNGEYFPTLVRRQDAPIDDDPEKGGYVMPLLENIKRFELEYWDDEKAARSPGEDSGWVDDWDTEDSNYQDCSKALGKSKGRKQDPDLTEEEKIEQLSADGSCPARLPSRVRIKIVVPNPSGEGNDMTFTTQAQVRLTQALSF